MIEKMVNLLKWLIYFYIYEKMLIV